MDPVIGVQQKRDSYWDSTHENYINFKEKLPTNSPRNTKSLKNIWTKILAAVTKFANHYVQAESRSKSGQVIEDIKDILYSTSSVLTRPMGTKAVKAAKKACKTPNHDHLSSNADLEELAKSNQAMTSANVAKALAMQEIAKDKILSSIRQGGQLRTITF
ncbi:hypothetical protein DFH28DRAFT_925744 [Melampsora americana]|nr:hypothetical protein DFH28DRAFT_925744 [Melampsora americana]